MLELICLGIVLLGLICMIFSGPKPPRPPPYLRPMDTS
jgi:hypothetical protein